MGFLIYFIPVIPVAVGTGRWIKDDPEFRGAPGLLGFIMILAGIFWPLVLLLGALYALCVFVGDLMQR